MNVFNFYRGYSYFYYDIKYVNCERELIKVWCGMINFFFIFLDLFKVYIFKMVFMRFVDFKSEIFFFVDEN